MTRRDEYLAAWPTRPTPAEVWAAVLTAAATGDMGPLDDCTWRADMAAIGPRWSDPITDTRPVRAVTHRAEQGPRRAATTTDPHTSAWHAALADLRHHQLTGDHATARAIASRLQRHTPTATLMHHDTTPQCARLVDPLTTTGAHTVAVMACWAVDSTGEAQRSYVSDRPDADGEFFRARGWQGAPLVAARDSRSRHGVRDRERDEVLLRRAIALVRAWLAGGPVPRARGRGEYVTPPSVARAVIHRLLDGAGRDTDPRDAARVAQRELVALRG